MIKGIDVTLYERTQTGEDDFGAAVYSETPRIWILSGVFGS